MAGLKADGEHTGWTGVVAVLLLVAAVLFAGVHRVADGSEHHSYNSGSQPASAYQLTAGRQYRLSTRGGLDDLVKRGVNVTSPQCTWSTDTSTSQFLQVTPIGTDARSTHAVASFVAPAGGRLHIDCADFGAISVDDADNATFDLAGLFLVLTVITLTAGAAFGMSALYRRQTRRMQASVRAAPDQYEIECSVEVLGGYGEIRDPHRGDVDR